MAEPYTLIPPNVPFLNDPYGILGATLSTPNNGYGTSLINWAMLETNSNLSELQEGFRNRVIMMLRGLWAAGYLPYVYSGGRTITLQAQLYKKFKSGLGLTAAPPGESKHNFGSAVDIKVLDHAGGNQPGGLKLLDQIARKLKLGFEWGASYKDPNHFEDDRVTINQLKATSPLYQEWADGNTDQVEENKKTEELKTSFSEEVIEKGIHWRSKNLDWILPTVTFSIGGLIILMAVKGKPIISNSSILSMAVVPAGGT